MARLETSAIVWLALLGAGILAIAGVGGYAAYQLIAQPEEPVEQPVAFASPPPPPSVPQRGAGAMTPRYTAQDAERTPDDAYNDLWVGIARSDAEVAMKYVPAAKLREMTSGEQVLDSFLGLSPVENVRVAKGMTSGTKAVLFAKASSPTITDARGQRSPIDVVVRMVQEDGHWKVDQQIWLVASDPEEHQASAMAWLKGR